MTSAVPLEPNTFGWSGATGEPGLLLLRAKSCPVTSDEVIVTGVVVAPAESDSFPIPVPSVSISAETR